MLRSLRMAAFAAFLIHGPSQANRTPASAPGLDTSRSNFQMGAAANARSLAAINPRLTPAMVQMAASPAVAPAPGSTASGSLAIHYLDPSAFVPARLVAAPPGAGSPAEALELASLHKLIEQTSAQRLAQAQWDGDHEDPSVFDVAAARDLRTLPATWSLLTIIQRETDAVIDRGKIFFNRRRPWGADPSLSHCGKSSGKKPTHSYPSGHSGLGYSVGWALAQLIPEKAPAILARANDYALSREICGVHFHSDTEASHVIGTLTAATLLADPRLADRIKAARLELGNR